MLSINEQISVIDRLLISMTSPYQLLALSLLKNLSQKEKYADCVMNYLPKIIQPDGEIFIHLRNHF